MPVCTYRSENGSFLPLEKYETKPVCGYLSILSIESAYVEKCNSEQLLQLLLDTADLAKDLAESKDLIRFYAKYHLTPVLSNILSVPDFFNVHPDHLLTQKLIEYHHKYGIPDFTSDGNFALDLSTDIPKGWNCIYEKTKYTDISENPYTENLIGLTGEGVYPIVLSLCFFLDFYNRFLDVEYKEKLYCRMLQEHIKFDFVYYPDEAVMELRNSEVGFWHAAYTGALSMLLNGNTIGICKHCRNVFVRSRPNAEYCSARCRNAFNVRMSNLRSKAKEQIKMMLENGSEE